MPDIPASRLPDKPDLEQERKRAKDLLKALRHNDRDAIARFRSHHPRFGELAALRAADVKLSDAQWVIAREYGFPSWPSLKETIERISGRAAANGAAYSILMWNDDATPMEFVVYLLKHIFQKSDEEAVEITLDVHENGVGVCALYQRLDEAEAKLAEARDLARQNGHPLELNCALGNAARKGKPTRPLEQELGKARAKLVRFDAENMQVALVDGRMLSVPLTWFPELASASADQRQAWTIIEGARALAWTELGLRVSVSGLLAGPGGQNAAMPAIRPPRSVEACRAALAQLSREHAPLQWAKAMNDLGKALYGRGAQGEIDIAMLAEAVAAHRAALEEYLRGDPFHWAKAQLELVEPLLALGTHQHDTALLEEAVAACQAALKGLSPEHAPLEWAKSQRLLGNVLVALGAFEDGVARFEEALAAFRAALSQGRLLPLMERVVAQQCLGSALVSLGTREGGTRRLEEAIATFEELLTDETRERLPLQWAFIMGHQGVAMTMLAERRGDGEATKTAIKKIGTALEAIRSKGAALAIRNQLIAYHEKELAKARDLLERLSRR
jgi:ATP-dependent Clp protease adapter protein ClpS/tetratricopeptide (TPR) repeat protein